MFRPTLSLLALLLCSCGGFQHKAQWLNYRGDGAFHDAGYDTEEPRYSVNLGAIALKKDAAYEYSLGGLPPDRFMVGLDGIAPKADVAFDPDIRVLLLNERRETAIDEHERLSAWLKIRRPVHGLSYLQGKQVKHYDKNGNAFSYEHLGVKKDEGWGSMFEARSSAEYRLRIEVVEAPVSNGGHVASLWVVGMSAGQGSRPWIDL